MPPSRISSRSHSEKETKAKKELAEKHLKTTSELAEKLKTSHQRIKGLVTKAKNYETEAAAIDELIFRKDFMFSAISSLSIYPRCRS